MSIQKFTLNIGKTPKNTEPALLYVRNNGEQLDLVQIAVNKDNEPFMLTNTLTEFFCEGDGTYGDLSYEFVDKHTGELVTVNKFFDNLQEVKAAPLPWQKNTKKKG